jgi:werner syndrome ATP-dependent helicase
MGIKVPFMALTATATPTTRTKIINMLGLESPIVTLTSVDRKNIFLSASKKSKSKADDLKQLMVSKDGRLKFNGDT